MTVEGEVIGSHDGLDACTIGQRHGFQVSKTGTPWYVAKKDRVQNRLIVVNDRNHEWLYEENLSIRDTHFLTSPPKEGEFIDVVVRYRDKPHKAKVMKIEADQIDLHLTDPVWAPAPGQSAVLYDGDICMGGGFLIDPSL